MNAKVNAQNELLPADDQTVEQKQIGKEQSKQNRGKRDRTMDVIDSGLCGSRQGDIQCNNQPQCTVAKMFGSNGDKRGLLKCGSGLT